MSDAPFSPAQARHELFELAASVRALVDWYETTGVTGVPRAIVQPEPAPAPMRTPMPTAVSRDAPAYGGGTGGTRRFGLSNPPSVPRQTRLRTKHITKRPRVRHRRSPSCERLSFEPKR